MGVDTRPRSALDIKANIERGRGFSFSLLMHPLPHSCLYPKTCTTNKMIFLLTNKKNI